MKNKLKEISFFNVSFEEIAEDEVGTIYHESFEYGIKFVILRGPASLCAYLGIPKHHPLANRSYDDLVIDCHGGLTYGGDTLKGMDNSLYWYGWDYGHSGDMSFYDLKYKDRNNFGDKKWTPEEVEKDSWQAKYDMSKLMKLSEYIYNDAKAE